MNQATFAMTIIDDGLTIDEGTGWMLVGIAIVLGLTSLALAGTAFSVRRARPWPVREAATWALSLLWAVPVVAVVGTVAYFSTEKLQPVPPRNHARETVTHATDPQSAPTPTGDVTPTPPRRGIEVNVSRTDPHGKTSEISLRVGPSNRNDRPEVPQPFVEKPATKPVAKTIDPSASEPPAWTRTPRFNEGETTRLVLTSAQYATVEEAEAEVVALADRAVRDDFERRYGRQGDWTIPEHFLRTQVIRRRHEEPFVRGSAESPFVVRRLHAEVELSPAVATELHPIWRKQILGTRLRSLGALFGMLTLAFGTFASYLRLDALTAGACRRRLKAAAVGVIVAGGLASLVVLA